MRGIGYLFALRELEKSIEKKWADRVGETGECARRWSTAKRCWCNVTLDAANWNVFKPQLDDFLGTMPGKDLQLQPSDFQSSTAKEGLAIPAQVNYVGKGANLYDLGYEYDGSAR
jgi:presequence protease